MLTSRTAATSFKRAAWIGRLGERRSLLGRLDGTARRVAEIPADHGVNQDNAFSMMTSPEVQRSFDLCGKEEAVPPGEGAS
jgi:hypothetical protein